MAKMKRAKTEERTVPGTNMVPFAEGTLTPVVPEKLNMFISRVSREHRIVITPALEIVTAAGLQTQKPAVIVHFMDYRWIPERTGGMDAREIVALLRQHPNYNNEFYEILPQEKVAEDKKVIVDKTCAYCGKQFRLKGEYDDHIAPCMENRAKAEVEFRLEQEKNIAPSLATHEDGSPIDLKKVKGATDIR